MNALEVNLFSKKVFQISTSSNFSSIFPPNFYPKTFDWLGKKSGGKKEEKLDKVDIWMYLLRIIYLAIYANTLSW